MSSKRKALAYCRVSSKEQEETGYSLEAQEKLLNGYAEDKFEIVKVFKISESASGRQIRKTFNEMQCYATKHKIPILLCEKIDRLTRNLKDAASISDWLMKDERREVHFVKEAFIVNKNTRAHENLVWDMKVAIARFYTNNLSEEVKKGQQEKAAQGWLPTKPPLGYTTTGAKGHKIHVVDTRVAPFIGQMFEWYATGNYSLNRLESELYQAGLRSRSGKRLVTSRIHTLLSDPFYHGKVRWSGMLYPGKHESLIRKDLFDKVQKILKRHTKHPYYRRLTPIFKSKMQCEHCQGLVTWEKQKDHWYGHCNNHGAFRHCPKKTYIKQEQAEKQLIVVFERLAPKDERMLNWIKGVLQHEHAEQVAVREKKTQLVTTQLEWVRRRKDKLYEDKLDGTIPVDFYLRKFAEYTEEEGHLEDSMLRLNDHADDYQHLGVLVHELAFRSKDIYEAATVDEKRLLLSQLFTNLIQDGLTIKPEFTLAAEYLNEWIPRLNHDYERQKTLVTQGEIGDFVPASPTLLAWWERLRTMRWEQVFPYPAVSLQQYRQLLAVVNSTYALV